MGGTTGCSSSHTGLADRRDTPEALTPRAVVLSRAVAPAQNYRQRAEKQEAAGSRTHMCSHVSARGRGKTVGAQHFGQAGESVCELSARVATLKMPCQFRPVRF